MTILFSGFAITDSAKEATNKIIAIISASILWHAYFLHALRRRKLWTRKASVILVIIYTLLLQFYAFSKLYPIIYLFTETKASLMEALRIGVMGFLVIGTSHLPLAAYSLMGWIMLFLLIADNKAAREFWSHNTPPESNATSTVPQEMGVVEKEKIVLSTGYPTFKFLLIRIYFFIPVLSVILWFVTYGVTAVSCMQTEHCDMPVLFPNAFVLILSIVLGVIYLFFLLSLQTRQGWTRIVGIAFALVIAITFHDVFMILFTGLILHYLTFDMSVRNAFEKEII